MDRGVLKFQPSNCPFCSTVNNNGILGTITPGTWHSLEMRIKFNEIGESDGEFMFFFDGELTNHLTGMTNMADEHHSWTHAKFWVFNRNPGATNDQSIYFKNYAVQKFSSEVNPNLYTTASPTEPPSTTHPITTTTSTASKITAFTLNGIA